MKKYSLNVKEVYETLNRSTRIIIKKEFCNHFDVSRTSFDNRMSDDSFDFVERNWIKDWFIERGFNEVTQPDAPTEAA